MENEAMITAFDPGETTGWAMLYKGKIEVGEHFIKELKTGDPFWDRGIAVCETSSGKDGLTSAYVRGLIEGTGFWDKFILQAPAERRKFLPMAHEIVKKRSKKVSPHMIDACAHLLCFLHRNDLSRYHETIKEALK